MKNVFNVSLYLILGPKDCLNFFFSKRFTFYFIPDSNWANFWRICEIYIRIVWVVFFCLFWRLMTSAPLVRSAGRPSAFPKAWFDTGLGACLAAVAYCFSADTTQFLITTAIPGAFLKDVLCFVLFCFVSFGWFFDTGSFFGFSTQGFSV